MWELAAKDVEVTLTRSSGRGGGGSPKKRQSWDGLTGAWPDTGVMKLDVVTQSYAAFSHF
jgi:hypothetical protein